MRALFLLLCLFCNACTLFGEKEVPLIRTLPDIGTYPPITFEQALTLGEATGFFNVKGYLTSACFCPLDAKEPCLFLCSHDLTVSEQATFDHEKDLSLPLLSVQPWQYDVGKRYIFSIEIEEIVDQEYSEVYRSMRVIGYRLLN